MRRILVTGGCGFIGSHFVRRLLQRHPDVEIVNLDALTYAGNPANLADVADDPRYRFVHGSIADPAAVAEAAADCEAIVNFAAETHVDRSILEAGDFIVTDVFGTHVLLEHLKEHGGRLLHVSTDEVYGDIPEGHASREDDPLRPSSPYSASKAGGDLQVLAYVRTYGLDAVVTRGSNNYGPNQYPEKLIPLFTTNLLDGEPVPVYGDGRQARDFIYVEDHCAGIETALLRGRPGEVYNVGGGHEIENIHTTRLLLELTGRDESLIRHVEDRPGHDRRYALDSGKLRGLGWAPEVTFEEGLRLTVDWYRENRAWWEPVKSGGGFAAYRDRQYGSRTSLK
jgi:dTDP-glucose 4,6-dehydratase